MPDPIKDIAVIIQSAASIVKDVKPHEKIIEERAEKLDIKNKVRAVKAESKIEKIRRRMNKQTLRFAQGDAKKHAQGDNNEANAG